MDSPPTTRGATIIEADGTEHPKELLTEAALVRFYSGRMVEHRNNAIASRKRAEAAEARVAELERAVAQLAERCAAQSEALSRVAEGLR